MARPAIIDHALGSIRVYGDRFWISDYCRASTEDRASVDAWLVATKHPLAMEPGTAQDRFRSIVRKLMKENA